MVCRHMLSHRGPRAWTDSTQWLEGHIRFWLNYATSKTIAVYFDLAHAVLPQSKAYHKYTTGPQGEILTLFCSNWNCSSYTYDHYYRPRPGLSGSVTVRSLTRLQKRNRNESALAAVIFLKDFRFLVHEPTKRNAEILKKAFSPFNKSMSILHDAGYQPHMKQKIIFNGSFIPDFQFLGLSHFFFFLMWKF